jgi:hypothetical protein
MSDLFPAVDLVGWMMAGASFDPDLRLHQDERCWVE